MNEHARFLCSSEEEYDERQRAAKRACFKDCSAGLFVDPENGCFEPCKEWQECGGWVPYFRNTKVDSKERSSD